MLCHSFFVDGDKGGLRERDEAKRCKFYLDTSFFVDLEKERLEALRFVREHGGELCSSVLLVYEYRAAHRGSVARRLAAEYGIRIIWVRPSILKQAENILRELGVKNPSMNTIHDTAHILAAKSIGAIFVTSDKRACKRAVKLGVPCINHRTREEHWPEERS